MTRLRPLPTIVAIGVLARLAFLWAYGPPGTDVYTWVLATALRDTHTLAYGEVITADYEPLYPLWLALMSVVTSDNPWLILTGQIALSAATIVLLHRLSVRVTDSERAGLAAATLYAVSPYLTRQSVGWLEIPLLSLVLVAGWYAWVSERRVWATFWFCLAALTRSLTFPLVVFAVVAAWRRDRRAGIGAVLVVILVLAPWAVRNTMVGGTPWPTRQSQILYNGNNPHTAAMVPEHDMDLFSLQVTDHVPASDRAAHIRQYIAAHPWHFIWTKFGNAWHFFNPALVPYAALEADSALVIHADGRIETLRPRVRPRVQVLVQQVFATVLLVAAAVGLIRRRVALAPVLLVSVVVFVAAAVAYYPTTRLRSGIDPILMIYAASLLATRKTE